MLVAVDIPDFWAGLILGLIIGVGTLVTVALIASRRSSS